MQPEGIVRSQPINMVRSPRLEGKSRPSPRSDSPAPRSHLFCEMPIILSSENKPFRSTKTLNDTDAMLSPKITLEKPVRSARTLNLPNPDRFEKIDEIEAVKNRNHINGFVINALALSWNKNITRPQVSARRFEESIHEVCRKKLFSLMQSNTIEGSDMYIKASDFAPTLFDTIQTSPIVLNAINKRLKIFQDTVKTWQYKETKWSGKLLRSLQTLTSIPVLKDRVFWGALKNFRLKGNQRIVSIIFQAFGDTQTEIDSVLTLINAWSQSPKNFVIDPLKPLSTPEACLRLDSHIKDSCTEIQSAKKIPFIEHVIPLEKSSIDNILKVNLEDVGRYFLSDKKVFFNAITINSKIFYLSGDYHSGNSLDSKKEIRPSHFMKKLLIKLYSLLKIKFSDHEIDHQIKLFKLKSDPEYRKAHSETKIPSDEEIEKAIPCLPILIMMTNAAWLKGDAYFREFYTPVTIAPYESLVENGTECTLIVQSLDSFKVTLTKNYSVFRSNSRNKNLLGKIPVGWTIERARHSWTGKLQIIDPNKITEAMETYKKELQECAEKPASCSTSAVKIRACLGVGILPLVNPEAHYFNISAKAKEKDRWHLLHTLSNLTLIKMKGV